MEKKMETTIVGYIGYRIWGIWGGGLPDWLERGRRLEGMHSLPQPSSKVINPNSSSLKAEQVLRPLCDGLEEVQLCSASLNRISLDSSTEVSDPGFRRRTSANMGK